MMGAKQKYAIIGDPVEHSLSPEMHETGFKAIGLDAVYHRVQVRPAEIAHGVQFLKEHHYAGWNVTYPLKEAIIPFLDRLTPQALHIGAVNTVKEADGQLVGHNTDGDGFTRSLHTRGFQCSGKNIVILGAGGAAKAIAVSLAKEEAKLLILNRKADKAEQLAGHVVGLGGQAEWGVLEPAKWLEDVDLLIQTTPVGMKGEGYPFSLEGINPSAWVADLIYHPCVTGFLADAERQGCRTFNGLEMLLYQGVLAWKFWLNIEAPVSEMHRALVERLRGTVESESSESTKT